jgi:microcompartment protein CcmK/EutM
VKICKVVGNVYGEARHPDFKGTKLLVVQPLTPDGRNKGSIYLAVDVARAGVGDTVLVMSEGSGVRQIFAKERLAIRSVVIGVIDQIDFEPNA